MIVSASLLSADFADLARDVERAERAGADWLHLDIMDGSFVPNITFGPLILKALKKRTKLIFDAHLMIEKPERYIETFAEAGADIITPHYEADIHIHRTTARIKSLGLKAGVSINPATPVGVLEELLPFLDVVLIMGVDPGFPGQSIIETTYGKVSKLRRISQELNPALIIEVDGGVNDRTSEKLALAGMTAAVAGSYIFGKSDYAKPVGFLKSLKSPR